MTLNQAKQLKPGDTVYWNDPDKSKLSRYYSIKTVRVEIRPCMSVVITDENGDCLECFASELDTKPIL